MIPQQWLNYILLVTLSLFQTVTCFLSENIENRLYAYTEPMVDAIVFNVCETNITSTSSDFIVGMAT